ncbi:ribosome maturation factor RimM, partial [Ruminococcaceae bacterium OttesenSCG-928-I18]|nr:ribosome maturation factor RimM [Ruminococcaceae bacterium OttesenSCG-928-I18]
PWCDSPDFLTGFSVFYLDAEGKNAVEVTSVRPHKNLCIIRLQGVDSIEAARPLIGKTAYIDRREANLPPGHFFLQDLLGARVVDADNREEYGRVEEVTHPGRHDVWRVVGEKGEHLFPAVAPFLDSLDLEEGVALVRPIEGMFEPQPAAEHPGRATPKRRKHGKEGKRP